jgi:hypothetical protein
MLDDRTRRKQLITEIEAHRGSRLIVYVTSDRSNCQGQIDENVVRPMYEHLLALGEASGQPDAELPQVDLFLYSRGGAVDAPWRIVSMIRTAAAGFAVVVPFRAQSAATMIALGADEILLGRKGELGPIDPSLGVQRQGSGGALLEDRVSVEDVMAYVKFVRDKAGITDQSGLATALGALNEYPGPLILGSVYRTHSHIRSVAEKLLESREQPFDDQRNQHLIDTLAERTYAHGHAIGRNEAATMGLPVVSPDPELERLMWELYVEYERDLGLLDPIDPESFLEGADERIETVTTALVESAWGLSTYDGTLDVKVTRQVPEQLDVALDLHVQMPPDFDISTLAEQEAVVLHDLVERLQQQLLAGLEQPVRDEVARQAPIVDFSVGISGLKWTQREPAIEAATRRPAIEEQEPPETTEGRPAGVEPH